MIETFSISQLVEYCRAETIRFQRTRQSDPTYCFELFCRALAQNREPAWQAIVDQYKSLVMHWAYEYGARDLNEDAAIFVNEAFTRMWQYGRKAETIAKLDTLSKCLSYLKKCVWSTVEEHRQGHYQRQRYALLVDDWTSFEAVLPSGEGPEKHLIRAELAQFMRHLLMETVQDEKERLVAELSWVFDLKPRQIQTEYPDLFLSPAEVSQLKKNILKRLKRKLKAG